MKNSFKSPAQYFFPANQWAARGMVRAHDLSCRAVINGLSLSSTLRSMNIFAWVSATKLAGKRFCNKAHSTTALLALITLVALTTAQPAYAWEIDSRFTSPPYVDGKPIAYQFQRTWPDFSPGAPSRKFRLKADGWAGPSYSSTEAIAIAEKLLKPLESPATQLSGTSYDGKPYYFVQRRFYLVSLRPAILLSVPHEYRFKRVKPEVGSQFRQEINMQESRLEDNTVKIGWRAYGALMDRWVDHVELSADFPDVSGIEVFSDRWDTPKELAQALAQADFPFDAAPSTRFPGYLKFLPRTNPAASTSAPRPPEPATSGQ